ncbi:MAG: hypothetical protein ACRCZO_05415 [Cetobacterium sp.]
MESREQGICDIYFLDKPTEAALTVSIALAKAKAETDTLRVKCKYLQEKIEDLTKERDFLRQQLSEGSCCESFVLFSVKMFLI